MNLSTIIVIFILVLILIPAVRSTTKHMKGQGACCGGASESVPVKKMEGKKLYELTINIEGMHCDGCKNRIMRKLNEMEGLSAKVYLARKKAIVSVYKETDHEQIRRKIENLGYTVMSMEKM